MESSTTSWSLDQQQYNRLVQFCWILTRDVEAAAELASETLLEGCRNAHKLTDVDGLDHWLRAIARNVHLRWRRKQARDARVVPFSGRHDLASDDDLSGASDHLTLDVELSAALSTLPATTRTAFLLRHLDEASHMEIAARTGLSEAAVSMRLSRARTHLQQALSPIPPPAASLPGWRDTRLWCSRCGKRQLLMSFDSPSRIVAFRCPGCDHDPQTTATEMPLANPQIARLIGGVRQPAAINRRIEAWVNDYFRRALASPTIACTNCDATATVIRTVSPTASRAQVGMYVRCDRCGTICSSSLTSLVMALPEVSAFRRAHSRVRTLPLRELEADGQPAVLMTIESVNSPARLDILSSRDTFSVLGIHRSSQVQTC
jgi:RNA polymerase sigma factor (sigma-70 family)